MRKRSLLLLLLGAAVLIAGLALWLSGRSRDHWVPPDLRIEVGRDVKIADLRGQAVLYYLWSPENADACAFLPFVELVYRRYHPYGTLVYGVCGADADERTVDSVCRSYGVRFPQLIRPRFGGRGSHRLRPEKASSFVLFNQDGQFLMDWKPGYFCEGYFRSVAKIPEGAPIAHDLWPELSVSGRLLYVGDPVSAVTSATPTFTVTNPLYGGGLDVHDYDPKSGRFRGVARPGTKQVTVVIGDGGERFFCHEHVVGVAVPPAERELEIVLERIIHLTAPWDSLELLSAEVPAFKSPVAFAWNLVPEADEYEYTIKPWDPPDEARTDRTKKTSLRLDLRDGTYGFRLAAFRRGTRIARFLVSSGHRGKPPDEECRFDVLARK
ncbi:TlpA family protein disulfide reductase [Planctomycetota bacterium]